MFLELSGIVVIINLIGLIWCYTQQSDKVTDLFYSLSFFIVVTVLWWTAGNNWPQHLMLIMVGLWSIRLGAYLFKRIHSMEKDVRFNQMRKKLLAISGFWTLQTVSIIIISLPIAVLFSKEQIAWHPLHGIAFVVWLVGWLLETIADHQKFVFRNNPNNNGQFVHVGLWRYSQHPNYLGEMLCWIGVFMMTIPSLEQGDWIGLLSPLWIIILLRFVSGIPLLQRGAQKRYGHLSSFQNYRKNTALLVPFVY